MGFRRTLTRSLPASSLRSSAGPSSSLLLSARLLPLLSLLLLLLLPHAMASGMPGAPVPIAGGANSVHAQELAHFAVAEHNKKQNSDLKLLGVVSATTQVVAGTLAKITLLAGDSSAGTVSQYTAKVWEKPWEKFKEVTEFQAVEGTSRAMSEEEAAAAKEGKLIAPATASADTGPAGLEEPVPTQDPAVQEAAQAAMAELQKRSNSLAPLQLQGIKSAALQRDVDAEGACIFHLVLEVARGRASETRPVKMHMSGNGAWSLH